MRLAHHALHLLVAGMDDRQGEEDRFEEGGGYLFVVVEHRPLHVLRLSAFLDRSLPTVDHARGKSVEEGAHQGSLKFVFVYFHIYLEICELVILRLKRPSTPGTGDIHKKESQ